jgi:hypothetical protein
MSKEDSLRRHPAGKKLEDIYDTVWAIAKSAQLAREAEQERIIKLLEDQWLPIADVDKCIALIKADSNG